MAQWLRAGRTEREIGRDIADAIVQAGHASAEFVIVASGPNGASRTQRSPIGANQVGDPVVVDIGGPMPDGYCSDSTRTYAVGEPPAEFVASYDVLLAAQRAQCDAARPASPRASSTRSAGASSAKPASATCSSIAPDTASVLTCTKSPTS